jgi:hypothetical protein
MGRGYATPLCRRIKIRWYGMGWGCGFFINGLKSVGIAWGEATPLCRRIKIRYYAHQTRLCLFVGRCYGIRLRLCWLSPYKKAVIGLGVEQCLRIFFCFMYFTLSHVLGALYVQGLVAWSFQINEWELKGYFVCKWIDFFWVVFYIKSGKSFILIKDVPFRP